MSQPIRQIVVSVNGIEVPDNISAIGVRFDSIALHGFVDRVRHGEHRRFIGVS